MRPPAGVVAAAGLVPAGLLVVDPGGLSPFGPAKWWAVSTLAIVAGALVRHRPQAVAVAWARPAWLALLAFLVVAALAGEEPLYAWTGTPERNFGVVAWLLCALSFRVGTRVDGDRHGRWVAGAGAVAIGLAGAWAGLEALGWEPVAVDAGAGRLLGPTGSAAFLGAGAALLVPVAAGLAFDPALVAARRRLAGAAAGLGAVALAGAGARAAWVGVSASGLVVAFVHRRRIASRRRTALGGAVVAGAVIVVLGTVLGAGARLSGGASRLDEWRVALRVVAAHPLGVGPEGYRIAFAEHVDARYEREHGREFLPDRAHNVLLDVALAAGLGGFAAYVALVAVVGRRLLASLRRGPPWAAGAAAGVLAYWIQQLFLFPVAALDPGAWLLAGLVVACASPPATPPSAPVPASAPGTAGGRRAVVAGASALAAVALVTGALDVMADRQARLAVAALGHGRITGSERHAERAVRLRPDVVRYRLVAARAHAASGTVEGDKAAESDFRAALAVSPRDPVARAEQAAFVLTRARRTRALADVAEAVAAFEGLIGGDRFNAELHLRLGVAQALAGDDGAAERAWQAADGLAPRSAAAAVNLAELYARSDRRPEAVQAAQRALERDPTDRRAQAVLEKGAGNGT